VRRLAVSVEGVVQGVGFRPFVHHAAIRRGLSGWVRNGASGVHLEVQGPDSAVRDFIEALRRDAPPGARIAHIDMAEVPPIAMDGFRILASATQANPRPTLPADVATCTQCIAEMERPGDRRNRYPFTNCTHCGPRYTIVEELPYDRRRTVMRGFQLCGACAAEYGNPADRRFHAQPIACPACGPHIRLLARRGEEVARRDAALWRSVEAIIAGNVLALKGLGGFQLLVDATNAGAVELLRARKRREEKPFAVMFPSLEALRAVCAVSAEEEEALTSPQAPILLVRCRPQAASACIAGAVAPRNPRLGAMLPYTPLHRLLLSAAARPLVCTSGNLSEEPMCIEDGEALERLGGIADLFLVHDRPIVRPVDDSVARVGPSGLELLRRARGFAPLPLRFAEDAPCILALGAQLKSTVALAVRGQVVVSQHLGDLHSLDGALLLERSADDLLRFFAARPQLVACDLHPDYASTRLAERLASVWGVPLERVQHHHAHVAACMAEHGLSGPVLGLAWDGAGLGTDGAVWGGEALVVGGASFRRVAHLRPFSLPGGDQAIREPRRSALGILHEIFGTNAAEHAGSLFPAAEATVLAGMLERRVNAPRTTSMGRLFDAVAALTGVRAAAGFEGQAAMDLEFAAEGAGEAPPYPLPLNGGEAAVADWEPMIRAVLRDRDRGVPAAVMAARFHEALAHLAEEIASRVGLSRVVLSGGCFQNFRLSRAVRERLLLRGFEVYVPHLYPCNDGGISLGQVLVAAHRAKEHSHVSRHSG
jgi:hydrogenase maturation protein HypF